MKGTIGAAKSARLLATRLLAAAAAGAILVGGAVPALAQEDAEARLKKVEAEVRALQRKVFPGPDGTFFEPQIVAGQPAPAAAPGVPAATPVTDMLTRMDAVESQMARLTAQIEQNTNRINQIEASLAAGAPAPAAGSVAPAAAVTPAASQTNLNAMSGGASAQPVAQPAPPPKPVAPSSARVDAVKAIVKPQTSDPGDDEYSYGFRLWDAKFYPEAQQQLKLFLEKYPRHPRASWGRNLLGRAYLDDGNPSEAAKWFLQNYQADKRSDRAPDSLLYLAVSMKQMKDTKRACIALAEFSQTYAAEAAGRLKGLYDTTRNGLTCG